MIKKSHLKLYVSSSSSTASIEYNNSAMPLIASTLGLTQPEYGYVLAVAISSALVNQWHGFVTGKHRKAAKVAYPAAYASEEEVSKNPAAKQFNCAQRAHGKSFQFRSCVTDLLTLCSQLHREPAKLPHLPHDCWFAIPSLLCRGRCDLLGRSCHLHRRLCLW